MRVLACLITLLTLAGAEAAIASATPVTQLPPIAAKKTTCEKQLNKVEGQFPLTTTVDAEKGQHPTASLLTCNTADAIALAGKQHFLKLPFKTGAKIEVAGATYTMGVGGPNILPATSGPVYGWFENGIEVLLIIPSGR